MSMKRKILSIALAGSLCALMTPSMAGADEASKDKLVVVSRQSPSDILPAATLSNYLDAELLIHNKGDALSDKTVKDKSLIVVGGEASLSDSLFKGVSYERIGGTDRYQTSINVLKYANNHKKIESVNLVSGESYPDAVIVSSTKNIAALISNDNNINSSIRKALESMGSPKLTVIGGVDRIYDETVSFFKANRISGSDRYETSIKFSEAQEKNSSNKGVLESQAYSFYDNIMDAKKSINDDMSFRLVKPHSDEYLIISEGIGANPRFELREFLIKNKMNNKEISSVIDDLEKCIEANNPALVKKIPRTQVSYSTFIFRGDKRIYLVPELSHKNVEKTPNELHILISTKGKIAQEYMLMDKALIDRVLKVLDKSVNREFML